MNIQEKEETEVSCSWVCIPSGELYAWQYKTACGAIMKYDVDFSFCPACGKKLQVVEN